MRLPSMHIVSTLLGRTARSTSTLRDLNSITTLAILTPPPVEPADAPIIIRATIIILESSGHLSKSVVTKPVVVIMLDTWKKLW